MEISVVPVGRESGSFRDVVQEICQSVEEAGLKYQMTPTATVIEGEVDPLLQIAGDIHRQSFRDGVERVVTHLVLDDRKQERMELDAQVSKVKNGGGS
ncbi:MTH1187 family thiamine-binding protein [Salinithrix halophila]|uniref:MTH1187 family thiamine-binding protein n=2 Tax=Salinithrix halophila TaxID=1485204 RepID=A0ABV8JFP3_9BACL